MQARFVENLIVSKRILVVCGLTAALLGAGWLAFSLPGAWVKLRPRDAQAQVQIRPAPARRVAQRAQTAGRAGGAAVSLSPANTRKSFHEMWQVIYLGDRRMGYAHSTWQTATDKQNSRQHFLCTSETNMTIKRFGQELKMQSVLETEEAADGTLVSFEFAMNNPPAGSNRSRGRVDGSKLLLATTVAGRTVEKTVDWKPDVKSPAWQERMLKTVPLRPGESRTFDAYLPELNKISSVRFLAGRHKNVKLLSGVTQKLLPVEIRQQTLPDAPTRAFVDDAGNIVLTQSDLLGQTLSAYTVDAAEALKEIAGAELDLAANLLVRVGPVTRGTGCRKAVYRIRTQGRNAAEMFEKSDRQQIRVIDAETIEVTVTAVGPPDVPQRIPAPAEYTGPTRFLQSNDDKVARHAGRAASGYDNPARAALLMEKYVNRNLTKKNFSTALASAAEVAESLEGDCTEHAVLLGAMLRARGIGSRVAVGLVYVDGLQAFGGHMWTEAWIDGKWIGLDATLGRGGIGAAHLKMADSSLSDDAPAPVTTFLPLINSLGKMEIVVVRSE